MHLQSCKTENEKLYRILYEYDVGFHSLIDNTFLDVAISNLKDRLVYVNKTLADLPGIQLASYGINRSKNSFTQRIEDE